MFGRLSLQTAVCLLALTLPPLRASSQSPAAPAPEGQLALTKIDPPNWWVGMPRPMLLVRGEALTGASFALSDTRLHIEKTVISDNGHWAQLWLTASPAKPETVTLTAKHNNSRAELPYTFAAQRPATDGMAGFNPRDVIYLIMTDRFADGDPNNDGLDAKSSSASTAAQAERAKSRGWHGGDIRGVLDHLDYLQQLGVTAVWLTPVYVNNEANSYHGYGATDLYGVDPHFGTLADLQALAKALHARGMKLVLDTVPNHVGPAHPWVTDEPAPNWFHGTAAHHVEAQTDFRALINPHAPERDRTATLHGWFANTLPDMNTDDPTVALYLRQDAVWWIEQTGADALRIDTFPYVNRSFWNAFNGELKTLFPHVTEVGEVFNGDPEITSAFADGNTLAGEDTKLYTPFDFPTFFAARDVFAKGQPMSKLAKVLAADELYPHPERLVPFLGNHDTSRFAEEARDPAARDLAFDFLMTTRGTPQIYSGDELAMPGGGDPDDRHDFPGGFPISPNASPTASPSSNSSSILSAFTAAGRTPEQQHMYTTVHQLAALRRAHPTLACGAEQVLATGPDMLVYARYGTSGCPDNAPQAPAEKLIVILQRGATHPLNIDLHNTAVTGCVPHSPLAGNGEATVDADQLTLQAHTGFIVLPCN